MQPIDKENKERYQIKSADFDSDSIAIVGIACRFPGAKNWHEYWDNLVQGKETIASLSSENLIASGVSITDIKDPQYVKARGILDSPLRFDASFFGIAESEAELIDPQQRLFLEECWHALDDAELLQKRELLTIGVYGGVGFNTYITDYLRHHPNDKGSIRNWQIGVGNDKDTVTSRAAYQLNLRGPAVTIQTACSTSLAAVHTACQALLDYQCDTAVAGGASLRFPLNCGYQYSEDSIESPDGHCRPFSQAANGTVFSDGVGVVTLMRLEDACKGNHRIYACISGSAINNDAKRKNSFVSPSIEGQIEVIRKAQVTASVKSVDIDYIEAHGTGTRIGDDIELNALSKVFSTTEPRDKKCYLGSVKSNIGHTDNASGVAGLIKTTLSLYYETIVQTLHCTDQCSIVGSNQYLSIVDKNTSWPRLEYRKRRAAVSSFGVGGTNVHLVLEEAPREYKIDFSETTESDLSILPIAAKSQQSLEQYHRLIKQHLITSTHIPSNIAYSLQSKKTDFPYKQFSICDQNRNIVYSSSDITNYKKMKTAWLFPGQGSQFYGMAQPLYKKNALFRQLLDKHLDLLNNHERQSIQNLLLGTNQDQKTAEHELVQAINSHLGLFVVEYSIAQFYIKMGVKPDILLGHSLGEIVAATVAGIFTAEQAVCFLRCRAQLVDETPDVGMWIVDTDSIDTHKLPNGIYLSCRNAPNRCVLTAKEDDFENFISSLSQVVVYKRLLTSKGFHSPFVANVVRGLKDHLASVQLQEPKIPIISSVTGSELDSESAVDTDYWANHIIHTVEFNTALSNLKNRGTLLYQQMGPGQDLLRLSRLVVGSNKAESKYICSCLEGDTQAIQLFKSLGYLWSIDQKINWHYLHKTIPYNIDLPAYPFSGNQYNMRKNTTNKFLSLSSSEKIIQQKGPYIYQQQWSKHIYSISQQLRKDDQYIIISDDEDQGRQIFETLQSLKSISKFFYHAKDNNQNEHFQAFDFDKESNWKNAFDKEFKNNFIPNIVIYLCNSELSWDIVTRRQTLFSKSIVNGYSSVNNETGITIAWLTTSLFDVAPGDKINASPGTLIGPARVLAQENPEYNTFVFDIDFFSNINKKQNWFLILSYLQHCKNRDGCFYAIREEKLYQPKFNEILMEHSDKNKHITHKDQGIKYQGVYIITGGDGGLGRELAHYLIRNYDATVFTCGRSSESETGSISAIDNYQLKYIQCDVANRKQLLKFKEHISKIKESINGIFHCAGIASENILINHCPIKAGPIFSAKVTGTQNIIDIFQENSLDFLLCFNSVNSWFGGVGQWDYSAANGCMNNLSHSFKRTYPVINILWDSWSDIGMAARYRNNVVSSALSNRLTDNKSRKITLSDDQHKIIELSCEEEHSILKVVFSEKHWIKKEHRIFNEPWLPATGFIALFEECFYKVFSKKSFGFYDIEYISPYTFKSNLYIVIQQNNLSAYSGSDLKKLLVKSKIFQNKPAVKQSSYINKKNSAQEINVPIPEHLHLGPRWEILQSVNKIDENNYKIEINFNDLILPDIKKWTIHPVILDVFIAPLQLQTEMLFIPTTIKSISIQHYPDSGCYALVNVTESNPQYICGNITVYDKNEKVTVYIEQITLINSNIDNISNKKDVLINKSTTHRPDHHGLNSLEALKAMDAALSQINLETILITSEKIGDLDLKYQNMLEKYQEYYSGKTSSNVNPLKTNSKKNDSIQKQLLNIVKTCLGAKSISIDDNFFNLGGDSLIGIRLVSEFKKVGFSLSLADIYNAKDIKTLLNKPTMLQKPLLQQRGKLIPEPFSMLSAKEKSLFINDNNIIDAFPLSRLQEGVRFHRLQHPGEVYEDALWIKVNGIHKPSALDKALDICANRHDVMRTEIISGQSGRYLQKVNRISTYKFTHKNFENEADILNWIDHFLKSTSNKSNFPLPALQFYSLISGNIFYLFIKVNEALLDGWSSTSLATEILTVYDRIVSGKVEKFSHSPLPFSAYVSYEKNIVKNLNYRNFWGNYLHNYQIFTIFENLKKPLVNESRYSIKIKQFNFNKNKEVNIISSKKQITPKSLLLSIFIKTLSRISKRKDIVIGLETLCRLDIEQGDLDIGLYLNTLPIRIQSVSDKVEDLIQKVKDSESKIMEFRHYPLSEIQKSFAGPLFDACFNYTHFYSFKQAIELEHITFENHWGVEKTHYPLKFWVNRNVKDSEDFNIYIAFDENKIKEEEIDNIYSLFIDIFESYYFLQMDKKRFENREKPISILQGDQKPENLLIADVFSKSIKNNEKEVAIFYKDKKYNYEQIDHSSNQLANYLIKKNIGLGCRVGIHLPRSPQWVIAILAVTKIGATFFLSKNNASIKSLNTNNSKLHAILSIKSLCEKNDIGNNNIIFLDIDKEEIKSNSNQKPKIKYSSETTAYLISTSGSSGEPKIIEATHRGLINRCNWQWKNYPFVKGDRCLSKTANNFGDIIWELFGSLCSTTPLVLIDDDEIFDPDKILLYLIKYKITHLILVPTVLKLLLDIIEAKKCSKNINLRLLSISGEMFSIDLLERTHKILPNTKVLNLYGSSEIAADVSVAEFFSTANKNTYQNNDGQNNTITDTNKNAPSGFQSAPVGKPINNTAIYILNDLLEPVEEGTQGNLYIAGNGLANGYLTQPSKTAQSFIPNPYGKNGIYSRMYCTGDIARLKDGELQILGRKDRQVNIRGIRIELDGIGERLSSVDLIYQAIALYSCDELLIFLQLKTNSLSYDEKYTTVWNIIRNTLLPAEQPNKLFFIDKIPKTEGGKVDWQSLLLNKKNAAPFIGTPPIGNTQLSLAQLWQSLLSIENFYQESRFDELGGHSIQQVRLNHLIEQTFHIVIPLKELASCNTFLEQSKLIKRYKSSSQFLEISNKKQKKNIVSTEQSTEELFLTNLQQAYWAAREINPKNNTLFYYEAEIDNLNINILEKSLNHLIIRHAMLRAMVTSQGKLNILEKNKSYYKIQQYDLTQKEKLDQENIISKYRNNKLEKEHHLNKWPLFSLEIFRLSDNKFLFCFSIDPFIADAHSINLLKEELASLYYNENFKLPEISTSIYEAQKTFNYLSNDKRYQKSKKYWEQRLDELPSAPLIPIIHKIKKSNNSVVRRNFILDENQSVALNDFAKKINLDVTTITLSCYALILSLWSNNKNFIINLTLFNRQANLKDFDKIVGDFTSTLLLEISVKPECFIKFSNKIKEQLYKDLDHYHFDGVQVARSLRKIKEKGVNFPYVYTRIYQKTSEKNLSLGTERFRISKTSDVLIDHQVVDEDGKIRFHWDCMDNMFPKGILDDMFEAYKKLIFNIMHYLEFPINQHSFLIKNLLRLPKITTSNGLSRKKEKINTLDKKTDFFHKITETFTHKPNNIALITDEYSINYKTLWSASSRIAADLSSNGVKPGSFIAILLNSGWERVAAVLATQILDCVYVPFSTEWPKQRILSILHKYSINTILVKSNEDTPNNKITAWAINDSYLETKESTPLIDIPPNTIKPTDLSYIIFTSGSTGEPKGVMMNRSAISNTLNEMVSRLGLVEEDKIFGISDLSFDLSVFDIFATFMVGAALVVPDQHQRRNPSAWWNLCKNHKVTIWNSVPALMALLVNYRKNKSPSCYLTLRWILLSGDWIPVNLPNEIRTTICNSKILSLGGATEAGIWSFCHPVTSVNSTAKSIPYGKCLEGQGAQILNDYLLPAPDGVPGELYITGNSLSDGYWCRNDLTQHSFIYSLENNERMYRTGDIAKINKDGNIELLGRNDQQIKINGYRVECSEIEQCIIQSGKAESVVVIPLKNNNGEQLLHAHIVLKNNTNLEQIKSHIRSTLPVWMQPNFWHSIDTLPLNSNGKIDRSAIKRDTLDKFKSRKKQKKSIQDPC